MFYSLNMCNKFIDSQNQNIGFYQDVWKENSHHFIYAIDSFDSFNWKVIWNTFIYQRSNYNIKFTIFFRSLSNLHSQKSSRSMKSVKIPWYQKPILHNNKYINVQRGAMLAALFSLVSKAITCVFFLQQDNLKLMT